VIFITRARQATTRENIAESLPYPITFRNSRLLRRRRRTVTGSSSVRSPLSSACSDSSKPQFQKSDAVSKNNSGHLHEFVDLGVAGKSLAMRIWTSSIGICSFQQAPTNPHQNPSLI
jgi:hypothetical protein